MLTTIIATIFVIGLLVFFHEFGHFVTAKFTGMRVDEFAIGFGPKLISKRQGETVYSLRIIPLGGFNKIAGMSTDEEQDERSFSSKPIWARMLVIFAGSFMNFVLPVLLIFLVISNSGIDIPSNQAVIGNVIANQPAARAGLINGDRILEINGVKVESWTQVVAAIRNISDAQMEITFMRGDSTSTVTVIPEYTEGVNYRVIGVAPVVNKYQPGLLEAAGLAVKQTFMWSVAILEGFRDMFTGRVPAEVAGPIGVAKIVGEVAQVGFIPLLRIAAFLSINIGMINLLPVPVLDGGHIVTLAVEGVRRKPISKEKLQFFQMIGLALLIMLFIFATFKDVMRIFQNQ
ncbi:MAG: metalloprotease RseP [Firmicutes bacterium]|nr:metalloprotease RseP [Bacillota bacterium]